MRILGAIIAGVIAAFAAVWAIEWLGSLVFPFPADADLRDPEVAGHAFATVPVAAKLVVVLAWFAGGLIGGLVASRIAGRPRIAWPVAAIVAAAGLVTILMIAHPVWMQLASIVAPLLGGLGAVHVASERAANSVSDQAA